MKKLACALLLLVVAPALPAAGLFPGERVARPDLSRPFEEFRDVVGVVATTERIDVYWLHTNELENPTKSVLYRTSVTADGVRHLGVTRIRDFGKPVSASVSGAGGNVQILWNDYDQGLLVSPIAGDALKYPEGKRIAYGNFPGIRCHATECVALFDLSSTQMATILDTDGNVVSVPFALPYGFHPLNVIFDERGIFFVRHDLTALRAALVRRDGSIQWDVRIASASTRAFHASHPGVTTNGDGYAVAFVEFATAPDEVHAVAIANDGTVSAPKRLLQVEEHRELPNNLGGLSLAANGSQFLLGGTYVIGQPFLASLDASLQPTRALLRTDAIPAIHRHPDGSSFIIIWHTRLPYLSIVRADGSMTAQVPIVPSPRRRAVR